VSRWLIIFGIVFIAAGLLLLPLLQKLGLGRLPGDIVIMDNLPAQKQFGIKAKIERAGAELRYLSNGSPYFNPIEMAT